MEWVVGGCGNGRGTVGGCGCAGVCGAGWPWGRLGVRGVRGRASKSLLALPIVNHTGTRTHARAWGSSRRWGALGGSCGGCAGGQGEGGVPWGGRAGVCGGKRAPAAAGSTHSKPCGGCASEGAGGRGASEHPLALPMKPHRDTHTRARMGVKPKVGCGGRAGVRGLCGGARGRWPALACAGLCGGGKGKVACLGVCGCARGGCGVGSRGLWQWPWDCGGLRVCGGVRCGLAVGEIGGARGAGGVQARVRGLCGGAGVVRGGQGEGGLPWGVRGVKRARFYLPFACLGLKVLHGCYHAQG